MNPWSWSLVITLFNYFHLFLTIAFLEPHHSTTFFTFLSCVCVCVVLVGGGGVWGGVCVCAMFFFCFFCFCLCLCLMCVDDACWVGFFLWGCYFIVDVITTYFQIQHCIFDDEGGWWLIFVKAKICFWPGRGSVSVSFVGLWACSVLFLCPWFWCGVLVPDSDGIFAYNSFAFSPPPAPSIGD